MLLLDHILIINILVIVIIVLVAYGDGIIVEGEACDTGTLGADDGCSDDSQIEHGYYCEGAPSLCTRMSSVIC